MKKRMNSQNQIEKLTLAIEKMLAKEVAPVAPIAPIAPILPIAPIIPVNSGDHDLLTKLDTKVDQIQQDLTTLKNQGNQYITLPQHQEIVKIADNFEIRLGKLESSRISQNVMMSIGIGLLTLLVSILVYHITR